MYRQSEKFVKQQYLVHKSPQYGERQPTSGWDLLAGLGYPSKFQLVSRLGFVTAATSFTGGQPNFAWCLGMSWAGTLYIHFRGILPPNGISLRAKFTLRLVQVLCSPILAALLHGTPGAGSAKLCCVVRGMNYGTFADGATYIRLGGITLTSAHILVVFSSFPYLFCSWFRSVD